MITAEILWEATRNPKTFFNLMKYYEECEVLKDLLNELKVSKLEDLWNVFSRLPLPLRFTLLSKYLVLSINKTLISLNINDIKQLSSYLSHIVKHLEIILEHLESEATKCYREYSGDIIPVMEMVKEVINRIKRMSRE